MMWDGLLQPLPDHPLMTFAGGGSRARQSRLQRFCRWQQQTGDFWYLPDLAVWRDHLMQNEGLTAVTVRAYLSTVRSAYRHILRSNLLRQWLYDRLPESMLPERKLALITEFFTRLKNAVDPDNAPVTTITIQDEDDRQRLWLTPAQAATLVQAPGLETLKGLRDTAMIALLLCTGIRAAELVALEVSDLRASLGGALALRIRSGKGSKQRLVPYGAQDWGLTLTEAWIEAADITQGPVFVGLRKGDHFYRDEHQQPKLLAVNAVGTALREYPIPIHGRLQMVKPHDLRRTYARRLYLIGTDLAAIQQNLGHDRQDNTLDYIGTLDADYRAPDDAYGTTWLQPLWEMLALRKTAVAHPIYLTSQASRLLSDDSLDPEAPTLIASGGYLFKIWLEHIQPQVWRRFTIPTGISFDTLHTIIQYVMGWEQAHLYRFWAGDHAFTQQPLGHEDRPAETSIDPYFTQIGQEYFYEYDFGDSWGHLLKLERLLSDPVAVPVCLSGKRACPPEDSGGAFLYMEFLASRKNKSGRVSPKWQTRFGRTWDSEHFDKADVNQQLKHFWLYNR